MTSGLVRRQARTHPAIVGLPAVGRERQRAFWRLSAAQRVALMRAGELTLAECCRWAAATPHEVPVLNGEFEFIAAFSPEAREP